jgi:epoxyqueuosine reductase
LLAISQEDFAAAFKNSPMKRAKLRGRKRNAAVVLGNVGTRDDIDALLRALEAEEALVREHGASRLPASRSWRRLSGRPALPWRVRVATRPSR